MKATIFFLLCLGYLTQLMGQGAEETLQTKKHLVDSTFDRSSTSIYMELLGPALISLNVESTIPIKHKEFISLGTGLGVTYSNIFYSLFTFTNVETYTVVPLHATYCFGKNHSLELGINAAIVFGSEERPFFASPLIGYRLYSGRGKKGLLFRFYAQPSLSGILPGGKPRNTLATNTYLIPPIGVSLGFSF